MLFIDDLDPEDMERINVNLGQKDNSEIVREHKRALAMMLKTEKVKDRGIQLIDSRMSTEYPWGEAISWSMLQRLCKQHPVDFLHRFNFEKVDIGQSSQEILEHTEDLFIAFTTGTWLSFHESFLPAGIRPKPADLKEAMEVWACQTILTLLGGKSTFLPSTYRLEGAPKRKSSDISFRELRSLFFPSPNKHFKSNAIWVGYTESGGYIRRYWDFLEEKKDVPHIIDAIHERLDEIFGQLQCLPQSTADSSIWHATDGLVCFLTNPLYYRIKLVSSMGRQTKIGPQRPQVSAAELRKRLNPGSSIPRKRKKNTTKARPSKSRNYRRPPTKRQRMDNPLHPQLSPIQHVRILRNRIRKGTSQSIEGSSSENEDGSHLDSSSQPDTDQIDTDSDSFIL
jgi:hypothetical protein